VGATVTHLADAELVYGFRLRMILAEDCPRLSDFDEQTWSSRFGDLDPDPAEAFFRWKALRESNVRILESAGEEAWERAGLHAERGMMTVGGIARSLVLHDRSHVDQLRRALAPDIPHSA